MCNVEIAIVRRGAKQLLYKLLPETFNTGNCLECAKRIGVADRTAKRWLGQWTEAGKLEHRKHGEYRKVS